jgi:hypothetical protein
VNAAATVISIHGASVSYDTDPPSTAQYRAYEQMFGYFNEQLFDSLLPQPILTFSRRPRSAGFFAPDGLMPSSTGKPGGARVGQKMSDYPITGGLFAEAFAMMRDAWFFPFLAEAPKGKKPPSGDSSKSKFTCPACSDIAWGKATLMIGCRKCGIAFVPDSPPTPEATPV